MKLSVKKNKIIVLFLAVVFAVALFAGCGSSTPESGDTTGGETQEKLTVVATIFPLYDWTRKIVGDNGNVDISMLVNNGVDLHSFQPTVDDVIKIATCDVFIYVGGESDQWVTDALSEAVNKNMIVVNLMDRLGEEAKEEETVEGMEQSDHDHDDDHDDDRDDAKELDEHVWLSLENAEFFTEEIAAALVKADAENAASYRKNAKTYEKELDALDEAYESAVSKALVKTAVFGDRFPFRYLFDDYGLDYYAAFNGCSAETEASFETITFLAGKVDELNLKYICTTESTDGKIADTIKNNTVNKNQEIVALNSMQSITLDSANNGMTYAAVMKDNLEVLKKVLEVR